MPSSPPRSTFPKQNLPTPKSSNLPPNPLQQHAPINSNAQQQHYHHPPPQYNSSADPNTMLMGSENIFSLDRANHVISTLLSTVSHQGNLISDLQRAMQQSASTVELTASIDRMNLKLVGLETRLEGVERAISVTDDYAGCESGSSSSSKHSQPDERTVGGMALSNRRALLKAMDVLSSKATTMSLLDGLDSVRVESAAALSAVDKKAASVASLEMTLSIVEDVTNRVSNVEAIVPTLVTQSDFSLIRVDAEMLRAARQTIEETADRTQFIEKEVLQQNGVIDSINTATGRSANAIQVLKERVDRCVPNIKYVDTEATLARIAQIVDSGTLQSRDDAVAQQKKIDIVKTKLNAVSGVNDVLMATCNKLGEAVKQLDEAHVTKQVFNQRLTQGFLTKNETTNFLNQLKRDVDSKAPANHVMNLDTQLRHLSNQHEQTKKKAQLSSNFIKWYGERGEVYENNLNAVDGHLKNLALKSATDRGPYADQDDDGLEGY
jgi:hypothetical protein